MTHPDTAMKPITSSELTDREMLIARQAAQIAIEELSDHFYKQVGKTMVDKVLIWIGAACLGLALAKGWITFPLK
jgi:hypothetical protein